MQTGRSITISIRNSMIDLPLSYGVWLDHITPVYFSSVLIMRTPESSRFYVDDFSIYVYLEM